MQTSSVQLSCFTACRRGILSLSLSLSRDSRPIYQQLTPAAMNRLSTIFIICSLLLGPIKASPDLSSTTEPPSPTEPDPKPSSPSTEVTSYCTDPGRPVNSDLSPVQSSYTDGETVTYKCKEFISLKQSRTCIHGQWIGDTPICGRAFTHNDMTVARFLDRSTGTLTNEYNVTGVLDRFDKFGNSFIAERYPAAPIRGSGAANYSVEIEIQEPAMLSMVRISFSVVNHLSDSRLANAAFDVPRLTVSPYRECSRVANSSVSPWHYNSTRFDYWFFCRSLSTADFTLELKNKSKTLQLETVASTPVDIDIATFILAEPYTNNHNLSDPICGLPEVPVGLEAVVINDQTRYAFHCGPNFKRMDSFGGAHHLKVCGHDLRWKGELPQCAPNKVCSKFHLKSINLVEVFKYDRIYYGEGGEWLPIPGSRAFFRCKDETHIHVGKEIRVCGEDGEWSDSMPNCLPSLASSTPSGSVSTNSIVIIVLATLVITFLLSSCTIYFFLRLRDSKAPPPGLEMDASYYATGELDQKLAEEHYETLEPFQEARYAMVNPYGAHGPNQPPLLLKTSPIDGDLNGSYSCIDQYGTGFPIPAPRNLHGKGPENDYYDDNIMDAPLETYQDSYQIMTRP